MTLAGRDTVHWSWGSTSGFVGNTLRVLSQLLTWSNVTSELPMRVLCCTLVQVDLDCSTTLVRSESQELRGASGHRTEYLHSLGGLIPGTCRVFVWLT